MMKKLPPVAVILMSILLVLVLEELKELGIPVDIVVDGLSLLMVIGIIFSILNKSKQS